MPEIGEELRIFVHAVRAGMTVYGSYTLIRLIRRQIRHNLIAVSIEDFLFWTGTSFYLFIQIYAASDGSVRWYFVLGVSVGMMLFALLIFLTKKIYKKIRKRVDKSGEKS